MNKLQLKDIVGYLPYNLKCQITSEKEEGDWEKDHYEIAELKEVIMKEDKFLLGCTHPNDEYYDSEDYIIKPILRPVSDLYKTIIYEGKEIIPLIELAKLTNPHHNYKWELDIDVAHYDNLTFSWGGDEFYLETFDGDSYSYSFVNYQLQLFDFLDELKIDYRDLIKNNLAVSVYDLPKNPYE